MSDGIVISEQLRDDVLVMLRELAERERADHGNPAGSTLSAIDALSRAEVDHG